MSEQDRRITLWSPAEPVAISASDPEEIVQFARPQLSTRDMTSIVRAFESESYEMVATFVWTKAAAVLKKQIATLGMDFVGEMLGRTDLDEDSDPAASIADHEAIGLAEDLGIISSTQGLRLKHALELVGHFAKLEQQYAETEMMAREEALILLKTCIASILSRPNFEAAVRFVDFRRALGERTLKAEDPDVLAIIASPYFFTRTTLSVLLSLVKSAKGAIQEHAVGNLLVLLPMMWPHLREPEKWQIGQSYAEVNADGNRVASTGLKKCLLSVHGFDFVPETLRSNTFSEAATRVLTAHFAFNNFHNEEEPMSALVSLGTAIPRPAFAKCMEATLAVWLGNYWGNAWAAEGHATRLLDSLRVEQWEYYFNECFRRDRTVLDKLTSEHKPTKRWISLASKYQFASLRVSYVLTKKLIEESLSGHLDELQNRAKILREKATD